MRRRITENRFGRRMIKESIDINKEQVIEITDEMKQKYPSLKNYDEILIAGKEMNWWDADKYAYKNYALLPTIDEIKDIWKIINSIGDLDCAWSREIDINFFQDAEEVYSNGRHYVSDKTNFCMVFCLR